MIRLTQLAILIFITLSCTHKDDSIGPLVAVMKLQAAETLANYEEAKKYIDVDKVYSRFANDTTTAEDAWKQKVDFFWQLGKDKKFTNVFDYTAYDISQKIELSTARVTFKDKDADASIKEIVYQLVLNDSQWTVVDIVYDHNSN